MSLKSTIQTAFVDAMKQKNEIAKIALSGLKAKIIEAEKSNKNQELTDPEIIKVIISAVKQRKESADAFTKGNRPDLAIKELAEVDVFNTFLPSQMTEAEIYTAIREVIGTFAGQDLPSNVMRGKTMGAFNKQYPGRADATMVKNVIENIIL